MRRSSIKYSDSILDLASLELGAERHSKPPAGDDPFARPDDADTALRTPTPRSAAAARDLDLYAAYDSDGAVSDASVDEGVVLAEALGRGGTPPPVATMLDCWLHTSAFCGARELGRLSSSCVGFARLLRSEHVWKALFCRTFNAAEEGHKLQEANLTAGALAALCIPASAPVDRLPNITPPPSPFVFAAEDGPGAALPPPAPPSGSSGNLSLSSGSSG